MKAQVGPASWMVAIISYNRYDLVRVAVLAYHNQTMPPGRIVVLDNSDSPQPAELEDLPVEYVLAHKSGRNSGSAGGFAAAMDIAAREGVERVVLSDQDATPQIDMLEAIWRVAQQYPDSVVAPFTVDPRDNRVMPAYPACPHRPGVGLPLLPNRQEIGRSLGWRVVGDAVPTLEVMHQMADAQDHGVARTPLVPPQGVSIPRAVLLAVGPFNADFYIGHEDYEWCARAHDAGVDILLPLDAVVHHHLAWHKVVQALMFEWSIPDYNHVRHEATLRNSLILARQRLTGSLLLSWLARECYKTLGYIFFGPGGAIERLRSTSRALAAGMRPVASGHKHP